MIESLVLFLNTHILPLGAGGVFVASVVEEVISPVPSPFVQMAAGFLFLPSDVSLAFLMTLLFVVVLPVAFGVTLGSLAVYFIAFYAGKPFLSRWGKWLGVSWHDIERVQARFKQSSFDDFLVFVFRALPIMPSTAVSAFCGVIRMKLWPYIWLTFAGTIIRAAMIALVGWQVGVVYERYASFFKQIENVVLLALVGGMVGYIGWRIYRNKRNKKKCPAGDLPQESPNE